MATSARPSVQSDRSCGVASECEVGLDSGMMIGRFTADAMSCTISRVNAPRWVERPIKQVGRTRCTTVARSRSARLVVPAAPPVSCSGRFA